MPSAAPGSVRLWTASTTISASSASIMTLLTRSNPFCKPNEQIRKPATTTSSVQSVISPGFESIAPNSPTTDSVSIPAWNAPVRNLPK